eukprot:gene30763-37168_t
MAQGGGGEPVALPTIRVRESKLGLLLLLRSDTTRFGKLQSQLRSGHEMLTTGGRELVKDGQLYYRVSPVT